MKGAENIPPYSEVPSKATSATTWVPPLNKLNSSGIGVELRFQLVSFWSDLSHLELHRTYFTTYLYGGRGQKYQSLFLNSVFNYRPFQNSSIKPIRIIPITINLQIAAAASHFFNLHLHALVGGFSLSSNPPGSRRVHSRCRIRPPRHLGGSSRAGARRSTARQFVGLGRQ
jgi:hypothetical protein